METDKQIRKLKGHIINPLVAEKVRPNDPCLCGSGRKAKKCCGTDTIYRRVEDLFYR